MKFAFPFHFPPEHLISATETRGIKSVEKEWKMRQCFRHAIYHTSVFDMACASATGTFPIQVCIQIHVYGRAIFVLTAVPDICWKTSENSKSILQKTNSAILTKSLASICISTLFSRAFFKELTPAEWRMLGYNPTIFVENDLSLLCRSYHFSLWVSDENLRIQILFQ